MGPDVSVRRRWFASLAVALALAMLVAGLTILSGRMGPAAFGLYWLVCLLATATAMVAALRELRTLQQRNREEQRRLFEATLQQIAHEAQTRAQRRATGPSPGASSRTEPRGSVSRGDA